MAGVPIRIHWTFSLWILLILANAHGATNTQVLFSVIWLVVLFASVTLHELSHSLVALRLGLRVRDITLLPFGGVSSIEGMDATPQIEAKVAIAGPLASVLIGVVLLGLGVLAHGQLGHPTLSAHAVQNGQWTYPPWTWLINFGWLNLLLAAFNMLPALPMDGGRVFRSTLARFGNPLRATRIAAGFAVVIGAGMIGVGLIEASQNPFLILIGGFVLFGAWSELRWAQVRTTVQTLRVGALMHADATTVPSSVAVSEVAAWLWHFPGRAIPVVDEMGRYLGITSLNDLAGAPPTESVGNACDRQAPLLTPDMPVYPQVAQAFQDAKRRELAVADAGRLVGILYLPAVNDALVRAQSQAGAPAG